MIEVIDKHTAKLIVNIGSGSTRKRRTKKVTYSGKRELDRLYREFETECKRAPVIKVTVKELIDSYIRNKELLGAKATTIKGYKAAAKRINSRFERISASSLTTYQIDNFVADGYNENYFDQFVDNLMDSEFKDQIASSWEKPASREKMKGHLLGSLLNAGVLTGMASEIARKYIGKKNLC